MYSRSQILNFDKAWCGNTQIPASLLFAINNDIKDSCRLAFFRFFLLLSLAIQLVGYFLITLGLAYKDSLLFFFLGIAFKIGGEIVGSFFQNKSGIFLSLEMEKYLQKLGTHSLEIRSFLVDQGCSESEINSLQNLPREVYQSELSSYQCAKILNIGIPIACGLALVVTGDYLISLIIIILGLLSFPIGEFFFKENTLRGESELRLGLSAKLIPYLVKVYQGHILLTTKVNLLSQLPLLLFAFKFIGNGSGSLLASFFGLTQGLVGLTGTLAFQKARSATIRTTETVTHLISALTSSNLIITKKRWEEHCTIKKKFFSVEKQCKDGILFSEFLSQISFQGQEFLPFSCTIPAGGICLLSAPSGKGKSTFLCAITHLIEHTGDLIFLQNEKQINAHELTREVFDNKIFFLREENIEKSARLIDLVKKITLFECNAFLFNAKALFDPLLVDLAAQVPDNLLEKEIKNIEAHLHSAFPENMYVFLNELRKIQEERLRLILLNSGGNLSTERISPFRNYSTLSSGEKRRFLALIAQEMCKTFKDIRLVILDEPFTHLDKDNVEYQFQVLNTIQNLHAPPALLIISHHFNAELKIKLHNVQEINL